MCGIFFSLSTFGSVLPTEETCTLLRQRGPDSYQVHIIQQEIRTHGPTDRKGNIAAHLTFVSTVLSLRGDHVYVQPLVDEASQSVLCWNGEAWKVAGQPIQGNDTELIFQLFLQAVRPSSPSFEKQKSKESDDAVQRFADAISSISGPFSFVFYDAFNSRLFFSRDCLGRRSLLQGVDEKGILRLCSLCDGMSSSPFQEVEADGVRMIDLEDAISGAVYNIKTIPWTYEASAQAAPNLKTPIPPMNRDLAKDSSPPRLTINSDIISKLEQKLRQSLQLRICNVPKTLTNENYDPKVKIAVLFSGGLDCTLLARLSHELLPPNDPIDLLNVAFENPRVAAAAANPKNKQSTTTPSISVYESCPDRITGRAAFAELQKSCPTRNWRFVAIDIPYAETLAHRQHVKRLMRPHNTEMDLSIACALYFTSRGIGMAYDTTVTKASSPYPYITPARILLSGLGADELFAGYGRHGIAFNQHGYKGLTDEISLDVSRLGKRNLGRDDRILCHWGREARYPFLDEEFVAFVLGLPVWEKCGFTTLPVEGEEGGGEGREGLDPEKKALRLVALKLGMEHVSREKKRAIQFGSRTAKMEKGRTKGTDALD